MHKRTICKETSTQRASVGKVRVHLGGVETGGDVEESVIRAQMAGEESTLITQAQSAKPSYAAENGRLERKVWHESQHSGMKVKKAQ